MAWSPADGVLLDDPSPSLASEMAGNNAATMAAITAARLEWPVRDDLTLGEALLAALETLERHDG